MSTVMYRHVCQKTDWLPHSDTAAPIYHKGSKVCWSATPVITLLCSTHGRYIDMAVVDDLALRKYLYKSTCHSSEDSGHFANTSCSRDQMNHLEIFYAQKLSILYQLII